MVKVKFTKKQIEYLQRFESYMKTAVYSSYVRAIGWKDVEDLANLWNEASGDNFKPERGCGVCTLNLFRLIGNVYFKQVDAEAVKKAKARAKKAMEDRTAKSVKDKEEDEK